MAKGYSSAAQSATSLPLLYGNMTLTLRHYDASRPGRNIHCGLPKALTLATSRGRYHQLGKFPWTFTCPQITTVIPVGVIPSYLPPRFWCLIARHLRTAAPFV